MESESRVDEAGEYRGLTEEFGEVGGVDISSFVGVFHADVDGLGDVEGGGLESRMLSDDEFRIISCGSLLRVASTLR
jgi:hypothetical protein